MIDQLWQFILSTLEITLAIGLAMAAVTCGLIAFAFIAIKLFTFLQK